MVEKQVFLMKPKQRIHLSQRGECDYGTQSWKKMRLLCESMFIPIEERASILKLVEREVFLIKPKHQNDLSQREECDYGAQSWKKKRLLFESMFNPLERWTSISKKRFFFWKQSIKIIYHNKENVFIGPNHEKKGYYYVNPCLSQWKDEL